jgi:regulator of sigma E protease
MVNFLALGVWLYKEFGLDGLLRAGIVALGLGFIIFIHELGHFLAAKWCDVHVQTFSIGFGPALPGCSFQRGETTYKIAVLPLGGYVNMVGEGPEADEDENYPRSFKNKSVGQRMLIISAGVIMNVLLGCVLFVFVYRTHGVERPTAVVMQSDPGSRAWEKGVRAGYTLKEIDGKKTSWFEDMKVSVALAAPDVPQRFGFEARDGQTVELAIAPRRENEMFPVIGVRPAPQLKLPGPRDAKYAAIPVAYSSPAAAARPLDLKPGDEVQAATDPVADGKLTPLPTGKAGWRELCRRMERLRGKDLRLKVRRAGAAAAGTVEVPLVGFDFGDRIIGTTDPGRPDEPFRVKALPLDPNDEHKKKRDFFEYRRRLRLFAGKPMVIQVLRYKADDPVNLLVPPAFHRTLGMRMKMGKVDAVREGSPGEKAGVTPGDVLTRVTLTYDRPAKGADRKPVVLSEADATFDPVRLPFELKTRIDRLPDPANWSVTLTVRRTVNHDGQKEKTLKPVKWDSSWDDDPEEPVNASTPMAISQLGIAYRVESTVAAVRPRSPAARAGVKANDLVADIRFRRSGKTLDEPRTWAKWNDLKRGKEEVYDEWAHVFWLLQTENYPEVQIKVKRDGELLTLPEDEEESLVAEPDPTWPLVDRGILLVLDAKLQKADSLLEALNYGVDRTVNFIKQIYLTLSSLFQGHSSAKALGGPIEIASQAFAVADDPYRFCLFLGIISINLAVVNFLPIPVLDGGHMVFLIYEKLRGRPPSDAVRAIATYIGLAMILALMVFVFYLDISRRLPGWLGK